MAADKALEIVWNGLQADAKVLIKESKLQSFLDAFPSFREQMAARLRGTAAASAKDQDPAAAGKTDDLVPANAQLTAEQIFTKDTLLHSLHIAASAKKSTAELAKDFIDIYRMVEPADSKGMNDKSVAGFLAPIVERVEERFKSPRPTVLASVAIRANLQNNMIDDAVIEKIRDHLEHTVYYLDTLAKTQPYAKYPKIDDEVTKLHFQFREICRSTLECDFRSMAKIRDKYDARYGKTGKVVASKIDEPALKSALDELDALEGLEGPKKDVRDLIGMIRNNMRRTAAGLKADPITLHQMYAGNPGTGKTTVARIVGKVFKALGVMGEEFNGSFHEVRAADLIAGYVGQTAPQTRKVVEKAKGGILFIDEAYSLVASSANEAKGSSFAQEAIAELVAQMENNRDNLIVIFAGYPDEMEQLLRSNPGLPGRIGSQIGFPDYEPKRLFSIFKSMIKGGDYTSSPEAEAEVMKVAQEQYAKRDRFFSNARLMRDLYEQAKKLQGARLNKEAETGKVLSREDLMMLTIEDIKGVNLQKHIKDDRKSKIGKIGFDVPANDDTPEVAAPVRPTAAAAPKNSLSL